MGWKKIAWKLSGRNEVKKPGIRGGRKISSIRKDSKMVSIILIVQTPGKQLAGFITRKQHCLASEVLEWVQHTDADPRGCVMTVGKVHIQLLKK